MRIKSPLPAPTVRHLARAALPVLVGLMFAASALALSGKPPGGVAKPIKSPPTAVDDSFTVVEDSGATTLAVRSNDLKGKGPFKIASATDPANGTVAVSRNGKDLSYRPDPGYCNDGPGGQPDTFQYTLKGGSSATVSVTVTCVDEAPVAVDDTKSVTEDDPATTIDVLANETDPDGGPKSIQSTTQPANGTVAITNSGADLTYTPDPDYCNDGSPTDDFTYTLSPGGSQATVSVTVTCVNDAPLATPGSRSTNEDTPLTLDLASLVSDVETADADLTYEIVTPPANGTATATTYTPDADFNGTDSFTYRVTDRGDPDNCGAPGPACDASETSSTETVSITVDPVNDAPQASPLSASVDEDGTLPVDLAALVSDVETADGDLTYAIVTPPAHGTLTGSGGARTYTPAADFNGSDSFTYQVADRGDPDNCSGAPCDAPETSSTETVSITVDSVNDAPVNLLPAGPIAALTETATPLTGISVADVDAATDDIQLELSVDNGTLTVDTAVLGGVDALQVTGNGTSAVVITASLAQINMTLADADGLVYQGATGYTGPDTLTVTSNDLGHNGSGGALSDTDMLAIVVGAANAAPVAASQSASTDEDTPKTITLSASDADGDDPLSFAITAAPSHGTLGLIGSVTCDQLTPNVCTADVLYTPAANYNGPDGFNFTANDGTVDSAPATVSITVNAVNDAPQLANIEAGALAYIENDPASAITATTTVADVDSPDFDTGTLTVDYAAGGTAEDRLEIQNQGSGPGQIGVSGTTVTFGGTAIGTFTGGTGTTALVVTLNANATAPATQALVRAVTYHNVSDAPSTAPRTVRFVLTDGDGATSAPATREIALTAVSDPPVLAGIEPGALAYTENDPATAVSSSLTVTDLDGNITGATVTIATNFAPAEDVLSFVNQLGITGSYDAATGELTLSGTSSAATYQTALRAVSYRNTSEDPSTLPRNVEFQVRDGPAPGNLSNVVDRDITVTAVNDAPLADDETFDGANGAIGNTTLVVNDPSDGPPVAAGPKKTITGSILAGDVDVDGPGPLTITSGTFATNDGGSVTVEADGDFVFQPAAATSCTDHSDFFDYTIADSGSPAQTDTGRVTIQIAGCIWYVSNNATGNSGISAAPFDTLAQAESASGANDTVFVFDGDNTSTGLGGDGYAMNAGERLIGEHEGLQVDPDGGGSLGTETLHPANPGARPTLTASNADVIDLDDGNEVRGFNIDPSGVGGGIAGGAGDTGGSTIDDVNIVDTGTAGIQPGLELSGTTGTHNITGFNYDNTGVPSSASAVSLANAGTVDFGSTSITKVGAKGLDAGTTNMGTSTFDQITVTGSNSGGVSMSTTTGTTALGDGVGTDLSLTTSAGAQPALALANAGTVSIPAVGVSNLSATGGPAVDVTGTSGATLALDDVDSTNSIGDGVNIAGLGAGTFTANSSSSITNASQIAFDLDGGSGDITYNGTITDDVGQLIRIANTTGGTKDFNGQISDGGDGDGSGIALTNNTGATVNFDGGITLSTGAANAFAATGGGTVNVTDPNAVGTAPDNTIETTTGTALNITNTNIGSANASFRSIGANGGANGIVLNNTGTGAGNGGLVVTGNGGACTAVDPTCTGGTIQNLVGGDDSSLTPVGTGVVLTNTKAPSLTRMRIRNASNYAIRGNQVTGFSLANSLIDGTNGTNEATPFSDGSISFDTILGTNSIANNEISGGWQRNIRVDHASGVGGGTMTLNVTGNNIHDTVGTAPDDGVFVEAENNDDYTVNVSNNTLANHGGDHVNITMINNADIAIDISGNSMQNPTSPVRLGGGIFVFGASWNGTATYTVSNNTILRNRQGGAIHMNKGSGTGTMSGTVSENTIGTSGVNQSGSIEASGIVIGARGASGTHTTLIEDNDVFGWNDRAIIVENGEGSPTLNATVRGNTADTFDPINGLHGFHADLGILSGDAGSVCLDLGGAGDDRNHLTAAGNEPAGGADVRVRRGAAVNLRMPGYAGAPDDDAAVSSFLSGRNDLTSTTITSPGTGTYSGGAEACPQP